ncbi:unnamed protein product [Durusdinium trenchii]|uniref:Uncharacterized protein n=1 Tax=Durusdinium trenchii TaxID=1381693 RepID=A0ABP0RTX4_9DINO
MQKNFIPVILIDCVDRLHCSKLVLPFLYPICSNTEATGEKNQSSSCGVQDALFLRECVRNLPCERRMASLSEARTMCQWAVRRATGGFDFLRKDWAKAIRVIRDSSERLKDDRSSWALFEEIERVVEDALRIEEVQKLSLDQVLVIDGDRAKEADVDTLDAYKGMPRSLLEFKPHGGSAVPIARIKALFAEPFFIGHEDGKLFLAFLPGQLVMNNISEKLAKALLWIAVKKLSPEDQAQFRQSDYGFTNKARTFVGQLRMAIQATKAETGV